MEEGEAPRPVNLRHDIHQIRVVRMRNEGFRMASSEARMGRLLAGTSIMSGGHRHDAQHLHERIFRQTELMFVSLQRMCRIPKLKKMSSRSRMADVEQVDVGWLGSPGLPAARAIALAPLHVPH